MSIISEIEAAQKREVSEFNVGDTVRVHNRIEEGKVSEDELKSLSDAMSKIEKMEAYTDYGCPFAVQKWTRFISSK